MLMRNYEDSLLERVKNLTSKLAQKQREGSLTEELKLCIRLAQLHAQLDNLKISVQFWQSCMQIATDLEAEEENWRAAGEIAKIYCKERQIDAGESFIRENLGSNCVADLKLSLIKAEVITVMGQSLQSEGFVIKAFSAYERALKCLDEAFEKILIHATTQPWWWDAVCFRSEILVKLGKYEEARYEEAIDVIKTVQSGTEGNVLMILRTNSILAKIYFELREYSIALEYATSVITTYTGDKANNELSRTRRQFYCEMLLLAGRALRFQNDFDFSLENLLLAQAEAEALALEKEVMESIGEATRQTISSKSALNEASVLGRKKVPSPKDLEDLAEKFGLVGNYEKEAEIIENCRAVATIESTKIRLDKKLLYLYSERLSNWKGVIGLDTEGIGIFSDWKSLLLKGRAYEKLGKHNEAEVCLLDALSQSKGGAQVQAALFFHYRSRGEFVSARKYEEEALSLEIVMSLKTQYTTDCWIDPNFSYFATRKPSNSMMKMVGSGMVMRTKTKKTTGLQLKRKRGPSKLRISSERRVRRENGNDGDDSCSGLSDFIVSDDGENEDSANENVNMFTVANCKNLSCKPAPLLILSSSDSEDTQTIAQVVKQNYTFESPFMVRTATLSDPFTNDASSPSPIGSPSRDFNSIIQKVIIRLKPGIEIVVPLKTRQTVKDLIKTAQTRFIKLFPAETRDFGKIVGLNLVRERELDGSISSALFLDDEIKLVLSRDSELLEAKSSDEVGKDSHNRCVNDLSRDLYDPSASMLNEDFKRKLLILNLKNDSKEEIKFLKLFQERFKSSNKNELNLSGLSLDSMKISEYSSFINKFLKFSNSNPNGSRHLNFKENFVMDEDLNNLNFLEKKEFEFENINFSLNFLQKPNLKEFSSFVDLSYNPIDPTWLYSGTGRITGLNLIGCFDGIISSSNSNLWNCIGSNLRKLNTLKITIPSESGLQKDFILSFCKENFEVKELCLFGVEWGGGRCEYLVELGYLDTLETLDLTSSTFTCRGALDSLCKILKRTSSIRKLVLEEVEMAGGKDDWNFLEDEGIKPNCTLKIIVR